MNNRKPDFHQRLNPFVDSRSDPSSPQRANLFFVILLFGLWVLGVALIQNLFFKAVFFFIGPAFIFSFNFDPLTKRLNRWLSNKEQEELRAVDLKLLSDQNNLEFLESDLNLSAQIFNLFELIKNLDNKVFNFISGKELNGRFYIFEHFSKILCAEPWFEDRLFTGVGVVFDSQTVPQVLLVHQSVQEKVDLKGEMLDSIYDKLEAEDYPDWLLPSEYVCFFRGSSAAKVKGFLVQNQPFSLITDESSVRIIAFREDMVTAFFEQEIRADGSNLDQFKRFGQRMLELQGDEVEPGEKAPDSL